MSQSSEALKKDFERTNEIVKNKSLELIKLKLQLIRKKKAWLQEEYDDLTSSEDRYIWQQAMLKAHEAEKELTKELSTLMLNL